MTLEEVEKLVREIPLPNGMRWQPSPDGHVVYHAGYFIDRSPALLADIVYERAGEFVFLATAKLPYNKLYKEFILQEANSTIAALIKHREDVNGK